MPAAVLAENRAMATSPDEQISDAIGQWWDSQQLDRANDPFAVPGTLYDALTDVDSLSAVDVLLVLEPIAGIPLPESIIKPGGYRDRQEMIDQLVPAIVKLSKKRTH